MRIRPHTYILLIAVIAIATLAIMIFNSGLAPNRVPHQQAPAESTPLDEDAILSRQSSAISHPASDRVAVNGSFRLEIVGPKGEGVAGATIQASSSLIKWVADDHGVADVLTIHDVSLGEALIVEHEDYVGRVVTLSAIQRKRNSARIQLNRGNSISGSVRNMVGAPLQGVVVTVVEGGSDPEKKGSAKERLTPSGTLLAFKRMVTERNGTFHFSGLPNSELRLHWSKEGYLPLFPTGKENQISSPRVVHLSGSEQRRFALSMAEILCGAIEVENETNLNNRTFRLAVGISVSWPSSIRNFSDTHPGDYVHLRKKMMKSIDTDRCVFPFIGCKVNAASSLESGSKHVSVRCGVDFLKEKRISKSIPMIPYLQWNRKQIHRIQVRKKNIALGSVRIVSTHPVSVLPLDRNSGMLPCTLQVPSSGLISETLELPVGRYASTSPAGYMLDSKRRLMKFEVGENAATTVNMTKISPVSIVSIRVTDAAGKPTKDFRLKIFGPSGPVLLAPGKISDRIKVYFEPNFEYVLELWDPAFVKVKRFRRKVSSLKLDIHLSF